MTAAGVVGYPQPEVETGDTSGINGASGDSDVYAVFYVEDSPVYAEQTVEIGSSQLEARCGGGWRWEGGNFGTTVSTTRPRLRTPGPNTGPEAHTTLDDDGNAVFAFKGISCAAGDSEVIADVEAGTHDTFTTNFTITAAGTDHLSSRLNNQHHPERGVFGPPLCVSGAWRRVRTAPALGRPSCAGASCQERRPLIVTI